MPTSFFQHTPRLINSTSTLTFSIYSRPDLYLKPEFTKMTNLDHQILFKSKDPDAPSRDWFQESAQHHKFDARFQRQFFLPTLDL